MMLRPLREPKRKPVDRTLLTVMILLLMMGLVTLFSATYYNAQDKGDPLLEVKKQLIGVAVGALAMCSVSAERRIQRDSSRILASWTERQ